jgi:hypothetical protein
LATEPSPDLLFSHGISILVHERIDVIVDQCRNFETFSPASAIMLHVSASAEFEKANLSAALSAAGCDRTFVNSISLPTRWGDLISAHFANIRALAPKCTPDAYIALNASNDMMLHHLPPDEGRRGARYELREVSPASLWYTGRQFGRSAAFAKLLRELGCERPVGGQIEGSSYPIETLIALADRIEPVRDLLAELPAVAEEVVFPTWAFAQAGPPPLRPFILFRAPRLVGAPPRIVPKPLRRTAVVDFLQKGANRIHQRIASADASSRDVDAIISGREIAAVSWPNAWSDHTQMVYCGIKRVARCFDDPLRTRIRAHTDSVRHGTGEAA